LVLDEFTNLVIRKLLPDDVLAALPAMAMEYAGVGVHGIIIGHDWNGWLLGGDLGAALRRAMTHRLICRSDAQNAEFLLPNAVLARQAASLTKGQALYWGGQAPALISIPRLGPEDLTYAAQGVAPRPYAPRLTAPPSVSAPTMPSAPVAVSAVPIWPPRPVPPTERLPEPTIPEQIVDLLVARAEWLTSTEIALSLGMDVKIVRNMLTPLERKRAIVRRETTRSVPEKYEYACPSLTQSVTSSITPAA
jgi:nucleoid-associated protein YgaU